MPRGLTVCTRLLRPGQTLTHLPLGALLCEIHGAKDHAHNRHRHGQQEQDTHIDTPRQCVIPFDTDRMGPGSHREYGENRRESHEAPSPVVSVPSLHAMLLPSSERDQPGHGWPATPYVRPRHAPHPGASRCRRALRWWHATIRCTTTPPEHPFALHAAPSVGHVRVSRQHPSEPYLHQPRG